MTRHSVYRRDDDANVRDGSFPDPVYYLEKEYRVVINRERTTEDKNRTNSDAVFLCRFKKKPSDSDEINFILLYMGFLGNRKESVKNETYRYEIPFEHVDFCFR